MFDTMANTSVPIKKQDDGLCEEINSMKETLDMASPGLHPPLRNYKS